MVVADDARLDLSGIFRQMIFIGGIAQLLGRCVVGEQIDICLMRGIKLCKNFADLCQCVECGCIRLVHDVIAKQRGVSPVLLYHACQILASFFGNAHGTVDISVRYHDLHAALVCGIQYQKVGLGVKFGKHEGKARILDSVNLLGGKAAILAIDKLFCDSTPVSNRILHLRSSLFLLQ